MTTSLTPPPAQGSVEGDGRTKMSRKKQWTSAVALLVGAGLVSAGGYAAVQSDLLVKSGVFSVDAAPAKDPMVLTVDNAAEFAQKVTFKNMKEGDKVSHDFTLTNKGNRADIAKLALQAATAKSNGGKVPEALADALEIQIHPKGDTSLGKMLFKGDLTSLLDGSGLRNVVGTDLPAGGKKSAEYTITVSFADNLDDDAIKAAAGKSLDSIDFTFRGLGK
ncbi:TasA family protein [Streptomyces sp. CBMA152]|uniref:TasA family protein n=1 Tax=Streptomyces sp. CBMA152 TaxID=1896312 RepID=UPI0016609106|nr:TasA family protein [Streptomyces sp. CBMA152]MBD0746148.1 hypothetical protein [Streptomyces sp. CBMA152]